MGCAGARSRVPAALHKQVRDFTPISEAGTPWANNNTQRDVTSGNAHPGAGAAPLLSLPAPAPPWEVTIPGAISTDRNSPALLRASVPMEEPKPAP